MVTFPHVLGTIRKNGVSIYVIETPVYQEHVVSADLKYMRYEDTTTDQFIRRVSTSSGITTDEKAIGLWANRASLTYKPIND